MIIAEFFAAFYSAPVLALILVSLPALAGVKRWRADRERLRNMQPYIGEAIPGRTDKGYD